MTLLASNHLVQLTSDKCWGGLVTAEIKTWVDLSKLEPSRVTRIANALKRGQYTGMDRGNTNVAVFVMLCEVFKIPYVLKGIREAEFPVRVEQVDEFAMDVQAMLKLDQSKDKYGRDLSQVNVYGAPSTIFNPDRREFFEIRKRQLGIYPIVQFHAPASGYAGMFHLYEKYRPPINQPGITDAVRTLKQGLKFEIPIEFSKEYKQ